MTEKLSENPPDYADSTGVAAVYIKPQARKLHDPDVSLEEYHYYAVKTRDEQRTLEKPTVDWKAIFHKKTAQTPLVDAAHLSSKGERLQISDEEWTNASRAMRTASTGAVFYLITTDILGPFAAPFAIGTLGYGPGVALFTVFGGFGAYSGYLIWHVFCGVDSYEYPARNYGDLAFRTWGRIARHGLNFMQAVALILLLGQAIILFGQNISELSRFRLCYAVCPLIFTVVCFFLGQVRTLRKYGWIAQTSVYLNLLVIFITMGVIAHTPPNYSIATLGSSGSAVDSALITPDANGVYPPIQHSAGLPTNNLVGSINGLLSGVLAYAGAQLFVEFLAEMKRPNDFLKAMFGAQLFIYTVYVVYGCYVYYWQGQYTYQPSYQGVSTFGWQAVGNSISLVAGFIAAGLYGNIGIKVFYNNILVEWFNAPLLVTKPGKFFFAAIVPFWYSIAYVIAASIPDYFGFVSVISASCLLNLTYTVPPFLALGYDLQRMSMRLETGDTFDPATGRVRRTQSTFQRWTRGFYKGSFVGVLKNWLHLLYVLASLSMCGLGMYAAVEGLIIAFRGDALSSFSCTSPLNLNP